MGSPPKRTPETPGCCGRRVLSHIPSGDSPYKRDVVRQGADRQLVQATSVERRAALGLPWGLESERLRVDLSPGHVERGHLTTGPDGRYRRPSCGDLLPTSVQVVAPTRALEVARFGPGQSPTYDAVAGRARLARTTSTKPRARDVQCGAAVKLRAPPVVPACPLSIFLRWDAGASATRQIHRHASACFNCCWHRTGRPPTCARPSLAGLSHCICLSSVLSNPCHLLCARVATLLDPGRGTWPLERGEFL